MATTRPWRAVAAPSESPAVPTMLSAQELGLLYWLGRDYWSGRGAIIDAGSFLGGSTVALASGIRDGAVVGERERPAQFTGAPITVFDMFEVETYSLQRGFFDEAPELAVGDDFTPLFERNVAAVRTLLDVRPGNILKQRWGGIPIEILFLDVLKMWEINDYVVREFWPSLIPERGIVVQQDYQYGGYPWIAITMELFHEYFERLDDMPHGTVAFRLCGPLPDVREMRLSRDLPMVEKLALMDRAVDREESPLGRAMLRLSRGDLLWYLGRWSAAQAEIDAVVRENLEEPSVLQAARHLAEFRDDHDAERLRHDPCLRVARSLAV
jgi:hypothetical protein